MAPLRFAQDNQLDFQLRGVKEKPVRLVAGLGNPGAEYVFTRHNVGFMVVERVAAQLGLTWEKSAKWNVLHAKDGDLIFARPMAYMNRSGEPLRAIADFYKIEPGEILVVLDDLALPLGRLRLRAFGGSGGHNGLESIILQLATEEVPRLRVGIGAAPRYGEIDYVLSRFFDEEKAIVASAIDRAAEAVKWAIDKGLVSAMNNFNQAEDS